MPRDFRDSEVISGSWGEIWINDEYIASLKSFNASVSITYGDVVRPRNLWKGRKMLELEGSGEVVLDKISSLGIRLMSNSIKAGKTPVATIVGILDDPDARGAERVAINNVTFDELTLLNFEHAAIAEESLPFAFNGYEIYDHIDE